MEKSIFAQIRKEANDFFNSYISPVPGYSFNQYETIKRCHLYFSSKFEDGATYLGRDKLFFNVVNPPCEVASKMLNVDTKNIRLWPINPKSYFSSYLLEKELRTWLKTSKLGEVLNQIAEEAPRYGSVVLEKVKGGAEIVDIRRLINDPSIDTIQNSRFVTTVHYMTPAELRETGWDDVDVAIERFGTTEAEKPFEDNRGNVNQQVSSKYIKVYKRYGAVPKSWIDGGTDDTEVRALFIVAGADSQAMSTDKKPVGENGVVLFKSQWRKDWPFRDFHYLKTKGRWLGVGVIEMLFDVQVRMNELKNQKRYSMEISSMHLFQTKDKQIIRNVLTDLQGGEVITSPNGIEPIATEERNLAAFDDEETSYKSQADKLTFAYEAIRGETAPSSTPLGVVQIATAQASSVFSFKRENLCLFLRGFFNDLVTPELLKDLTPEHIMRFTGSAQELQKLDEMASEVAANDYIKNKLMKGGSPLREDVESVKQQFINGQKKLGTNRFIKMKDAFYDDTEFEFDYIIDNEQADPQTLATNLGKVIGDLAGNPAILQDPRLKLLYFKFAEKIGINPAELELADSESQKLQANQQINGQPNQQPTQGQPSGTAVKSSILPGAGQAQQTAPSPAQFGG